MHTLRVLGWSLLLSCPALFLVPPVATAEEGITTAEADALAERFEAIVAGWSFDDLELLFDMGVYWNRTLSGLEDQAALEEVMAEDTAPADFLQDLLPFLRRGEPYRYVGQRRVDGHPCLLFRLAGSAGLLYHSWCMHKARGGSIKLVDMYNYGSGFWTSESSRAALLITFPELDPASGPQRLSHAAEVEALQEALMTGEYAVVEEVYQSLPRALKNDRLLMLLRMKAAQQHDTSLYETALGQYIKAHPTDRSITFQKIERAMLSKKFQVALDLFDVVERYVGGDPFLNVGRAIPLLKLERYEEAARRLDAYMEVEAPTQDVLIMRAVAAIGSRAFEAGAMWLRRWERSTGHSGFRIVDERLPHYEEFLASAPYLRWKAAAERSRGAPTSFEGSPRQLADAMGEELEAGDTGLVDRMFDLEAFLTRMARGLPANPRLTDRMKRYMQTIALPGKALAALIRQPGSRLKALGMRKVDGEHCLAIRVAGHGQTGYFGLAVRAKGRAAVIVDFYNYPLGQWMSEIMRWYYLERDPGADPGSAPERRTWAKAYGQMQAAWGEGRFAEGMRLYERLPASYRNNRTILALRLLAARQAGSDDYERALETLFRLFPGDVGGLMSAMEHGMQQGTFSKALASVDALDEAIGGDPFLDVWRARILVRMGRTEKARALVRTFRDREREGEKISDTWITLGDCAVTDGFFQVAAHCYKRAADLLPGSPIEIWKGLSNYEEFVASKPYRYYRDATK